MKRITLGKSVIGEGRAFLVAEVGINHNGNLALAKEAATKARESGADAVKFQIFKTELFYSPDHEGFSQTGGDVFKLMKSLELREEWKELKARRQRGSFSPLPSIHGPSHSLRDGRGALQGGLLT